MQIKQALSAATRRLTESNVPSPRMNAELLLRFVLDCDRAYLFAHPERALSADERSRYESALDTRSKGVPAQYITGHQEFWGLDLIVTPAVLIPRPETEHVVETVLELVKSPPKSQRFADLPKTVRVADVGTGSGCIALALAKELPGAEIHATDISASALEIAQANTARHQLQERIHFHQGDLLAGLTPPFDVIVSNPPYVGEAEQDQVQFEVRKFEPRQAVFAGPTGTEVIARLISEAWMALRPGGSIVFEISGTISDGVRHLLAGWDDPRLLPDLQGIPRVAVAHKRET